MKRNLLLVSALIFAIFLGVNSARKIMSFHGTSQKVEEAEQKLGRLRKEHEALQKELEFKKSAEFKEMEIRNKLGLVKEGETVVIVPREGDERQTTNDERQEQPNWVKWKILFFGDS
jgi:cell division protein FtsB